MTRAAEKPLFIPLKAKFFDAFDSGEKTTEYRRFGGPWNLKTCRPGRAVTLSRGYGKQRRIAGRIKAARLVFDPVKNVPAWREVYGDDGAGCCLAIEIEVVR